MANLFENMDLSGNSLNISDINNFIFLKDFDRNFLASNGMNSQFDFSKCSLSEILGYVVIAYGSAFL